MGGEAPGPPHVPGLLPDYLNHNYVLHELYNYCTNEWEAKHPGRHTCQARAAAFDFSIAVVLVSVFCCCSCCYDGGGGDDGDGDGEIFEAREP